MSGTPPLITPDFLLETDAARALYHTVAADLPILDYHCHLPPAQIADDHRFANLAEVWLGGDHYKWRLMRANGVPERYCTGDASDWEKFAKWAETVPDTLRNPLYHWTHLELARFFGITDRLLGPDTARGIWDACNARLAEPGMSARGLMLQSNVRLVCTTDDPIDALDAHRRIAADPEFPVQVLPTWRPDKGMAVEDPAAFNAWVDALGTAADAVIRTFDQYLDALRSRHAVFHSMGCRLSDHGIETAYAADYTDAEIARAFSRLRSGKPLERDAILKFKSAMLYAFGLMDHAAGWTQQFHFNALRNNNTRMAARLGPDSGFDSIGDAAVARPLGRLLDRLDRNGTLARTIVYTLNPADNAPLITMLGNFQDGTVPGKMQFGSGWWFLDQIDGMERQMEDVSNFGLLRRFVGMLTDSRSFLSYPRHEYFRRILCNLLGRDIACGRLPNDLELAGRMVHDVSYGNAARYFGFAL
jgi:glucuronate isomerase